MSTVANITLVANVGRIDAAKTFDNGRLASFSAAVGRKFKRGGEVVEETDWYTVKTNAPKLIERIEKHLSKGDQVIVSGTLSIKTFERQNGEKGTAIEIFAHMIERNISKKSDEMPGADKAAEQQHQDLDDEVPF